MHRFIFTFFIFLAALRADGAMVRVIAVENGRTLAVEREGRRELVRLAGVEVLDELHARELLRWTIGNSWVLIEPAGDGAFLVHRSPDALFVNRELVLRGYARATMEGISPRPRLAMTYLGEIDPAGPQPKTTTRAAPATTGTPTTTQRSRRTPRPSRRGRR